MDLWVIFVLAGCVLGIGEIVTTGFFLAPFSLAAFIAAGLGLVGASDALQVISFVVSAIVLFAFVRPIARKHTQMPPLARTGTDALIGQRALVMERISNDEAVGLVRIGGEVWTARTLDESIVIAEGTAVTVVEIRGATALVSEM